MTLRTPEDSSASWLDADDSYQAADFLEEATLILHDEEGDFSDACHDQLRHEYEQWKRIPHLRIIGKRIESSSEKNNKPNDDQQSFRCKPSNNRDLDSLRDQVIKIMTEILWQRVLEKTTCVENVGQLRTKTIKYDLKDAFEAQRRSSGQIKSALIVSPILPANRPPILFKSRSHLETINQNTVRVRSNTAKYSQKPWSKSRVNVLPPIEIHQKKALASTTAEKTTKRWFSAVSTPDRNCALPRPVTSVTANVDTTICDVCFDISIDGKSIKGLKKKVFCSPS